MVALIYWQIIILTLDLYPGSKFHVYQFPRQPVSLHVFTSFILSPSMSTFHEKDFLDHGISELQGTLVSKQLVQGVPN